MSTNTTNKRKTFPNGDQEIGIRLNSDHLLNIAGQNEIQSGKQLADNSAINTPNFYELMSGKTFPTIVTLCRLLSGAGLTLQEIKGVTLGEILIFQANHEQAQN